MKDLLLFLWQLPQNIVGLLLAAALRSRESARVDYDGRTYHVVPTFPGGVSLGDHVFVRYGFLSWEPEWKHEFGHTIQSRILGPLYLLIVGLPSLLWAWWWNPGRGSSYYGFWTERWADRLGDVER